MRDEEAISQASIGPKEPRQVTTIAATGADVTMYRDSDVIEGQTYRYIVRAKNSYGESPASNEAEVVVR